jgi:ribosomal protein L11 methylase PrmA
VLKWYDFNFDIIVANIEKNIIKKIIYNIGDTKARFVFSGLLQEDKDEMEEILIDNKFLINKIVSKNEWIAIDCNKE